MERHNQKDRGSDTAGFVNIHGAANERQIRAYAEAERADAFKYQNEVSKEAREVVERQAEEQHEKAEEKAEEEGAE